MEPIQPHAAYVIGVFIAIGLWYGSDVNGANIGAELAGFYL